MSLRQTELLTLKDHLLRRQLAEVLEELFLTRPIVNLRLMIGVGVEAGAHLVRRRRGGGRQRRPEAIGGR